MSDEEVEMKDFEEVEINGHWPLMLPADRVEHFRRGPWEPERLQAMRMRIEPLDVVFDVGAEQGDLPALWASWGAQVVPFEPEPDIWPNIRACFQANGIDPPLAWFVGFASDVTELEPMNPIYDGNPLGILYSTTTGWPGCAFGEHFGADRGFHHLAQEDDAIAQITIDDFVVATGLVPDHITIDVEGSELRVLQGAEHTLSNHHPTVWVSIHTDRQWMVEQYGGVGEEEVRAFMARCGYAGRKLAEDHEAHWEFL